MVKLLTVSAGIIENAEALIEEIVLAGKVLKSLTVIPALNRIKQHHINYSYKL